MSLLELMTDLLIKDFIGCGKTTPEKIKDLIVNDQDSKNISEFSEKKIRNIVLNASYSDLPRYSIWFAILFFCREHQSCHTFRASSTLLKVQSTTPSSVIRVAFLFGHSLIKQYMTFSFHINSQYGKLKPLV
jgi:deoxyadenosine/deoxycytidine kinase